MIVIYENPVMKSRAVTLDGYAYVGESSNYFYNCGTGPVNMKLGNGSRRRCWITGDYLAVQKTKCRS
jgi:hypothetical protein